MSAAAMTVALVYLACVLTTTLGALMALSAAAIAKRVLGLALALTGAALAAAAFGATSLALAAAAAGVGAALVCAAIAARVHETFATSDWDEGAARASAEDAER
ncbi:MAG: hypothetical protein GC206_00305 [Alphaproteobacteria bacterium]|nr:hypothetical protein [Alphaproteobacteria bacterium]